MSRTAIIIPTYNHLEDCLRPCIDSIVCNTDLNDVNGARVIVVANGCTDGTHEYLTELSRNNKWLTSVLMPDQMGFTKAANIGLNVAMRFDDVDKIVLLNNDVTLMGQPKNAWIEILRSGFINSNVAATGVIIKNDEATLLPFLIFFCVMIDRSALDAIGLLDEAFSPGFGEDIDFCTRALRAGYEIVQVPIGQELGHDGHQYVCSFPIYHAGTTTFSHEITYNEVVKRNIQRLFDKHINNK